VTDDVEKLLVGYFQGLRLRHIENACRVGDGKLIFGKQFPWSFDTVEWGTIHLELWRV
jgi:hypothetical protein